MKAPVFFCLLVLISGCLCCPLWPKGESTTTTIETIVTTTEVSTTQKTTTLPTTTLPGQNTTTTTLIPQDKASCEAVGGLWGRIGLAPMNECNLPTKDGGKPCSDQSECDGACLAALSLQQKQMVLHGEPVHTTGICTPYQITAGCQARVENGAVNGILCID